MCNEQLTFADRFFVSVQTLEGRHLQETTGHTITRDAIVINHAEEMGNEDEGREGDKEKVGGKVRREEQAPNQENREVMRMNIDRK